MKDYARYSTGVLLATVSSGPIFVGIYCLWLIVDTFQNSEVNSSMIMPLLWALLIATVFGPIVAFVPVFIGTKAMAWLGIAEPETRRAWLWCSVGAAMVMTPAVMLGGLAQDPRALLLTVSLTLTAIIAAFICFRHTRWETLEEAPLPLAD